MDFVLDASTTLAWCFEEEHSDRADEALDRLLNGTALAPPVWRLEVANSLLVAEREGRIEEPDTDRFLSRLQKFPIETVQPSSPENAFRPPLTLGRKHEISAYDASYLDLAVTRDLPLATLDRRLESVASERNVEVFLEE